MLAAMLEDFGRPLRIGPVEDPVAGRGDVIVAVAAAGVLSYMHEVLSGQREYMFETPQIPGAGAIGRVLEVGPDVVSLRPGEWVLCDATIRSRDDARDPEITLQGLSARGEGGLRLQRAFRHGSWAEKARIPAENASRLGEIAPEEAARWAPLTSALVPFGGWRSIGLSPGETALVSGATGPFGAASVAVALAMGAAWVMPVGRNAAVLEDYVRRFGDRVRPVVLSGEPEADHERMLAAAPGPIDCMMDLLPPFAPPAVVRAAAMTLRRGGRASLMGGVGMQDGAELSLPYRWIMRSNITIRGQWMFERDAVPALIAMAKAGLLDLGQWRVDAFPLAQAEAAVAHAAAHGGPFRTTVLVP